MKRLAILASHPIQYYSPLFRDISKHLDLTVFYGHEATAQDQAKAGFGVRFDWDVDLLTGYRSEFLRNTSRYPGLDSFSGIDTPEIGSRLKHGNFDALLLMGWHRKCFIQALLTAKRIRLPVMVRGDSHLQTPRSWLKRKSKDLIYPHFLKMFDAALVVGERNRLYWNHYSYPPDQIFHSPHCVDNDWFAVNASLEAGLELRRSLSVSHDTKLVLFAGKLVAFKRPCDLIQAVSKVNSKIDVVVAGDGELAGEIRALAESKNVNLHMLGFCNQSRMPSVYAACDLLVLPSDARETWGLVVNEALAASRPVLISDHVGCAPDMAALLGSNVVFALGDTEHLAKQMRVQLDEKPQINCLSYAASCFSQSKAVEGVLKAFESICRRT